MWSKHIFQTHSLSFHVFPQPYCSLTLNICIFFLSLSDQSHRFKSSDFYLIYYNICDVIFKSCMSNIYVLNNINFQYSVNVRLSLWLTKNHAMKTYV